MSTNNYTMPQEATSVSSRHIMMLRNYDADLCCAKYLAKKLPNFSCYFYKVRDAYWPSTFQLQLLQREFEIITIPSCRTMTDFCQRLLDNRKNIDELRQLNFESYLYGGIQQLKHIQKEYNCSIYFYEVSESVKLRTCVYSPDITIIQIPRRYFVTINNAFADLKLTSLRNLPYLPDPRYKLHTKQQQFQLEKLFYLELEHARFSAEETTQRIELFQQFCRFSISRAYYLPVFDVD